MGISLRKLRGFNRSTKKKDIYAYVSRSSRICILKSRFELICDSNALTFKKAYNETIKNWIL